MAVAFGMGSHARSKASAPAQKAPAAKPKLVSVTVKLSPEQKEKLAELGGDAWVRERIDEASAAAAFTLSDPTDPD